MRYTDLRHEYASRLVERGVPLSQVRDLLGHASITTTERYDNQTTESLQAAARLERGETFDSSSPRAQISKFQDSFKIMSDDVSDSDEVSPVESTANSLTSNNLLVWLAVRDEFRNWLIHAA